MLVVIWVLYGLKRSGTSRQNVLANALEKDFGFKPTRADPDVHGQPAEKDCIIKRCKALDLKTW